MLFTVLILSHSLLLITQTYSVVGLHTSDTRLAGLPVGSGNPGVISYGYLGFRCKIQPPAACESDYTLKSPGWQPKLLTVQIQFCELALNSK